MFALCLTDYLILYGVSKFCIVKHMLILRVNSDNGFFQQAVYGLEVVQVVLGVLRLDWKKTRNLKNFRLFSLVCYNL